MKSRINIVFDIIAGWTNRAEVKICKSMIQNNNKLISQAEFIIDKQEEIVNKGRLIKSDKGTYFTVQKNVDYDNAVNVKTKVEILKADLNNINGFYNILIEAYSKKVHSKQDIISDAKNKILNVKNNMLNVTDGLSPEEYIYKYFQKEPH